MTGFDAFFPEREPRANLFWNVERIDLLKKLVGEGISAAAIAEQIPGSTRNSVLGAIRRNGLQLRHRPTGSVPSAPRDLTSEERKVVRSTGSYTYFNKDRPPSQPVWGDKPTKFDLAIPADQRRQLLELGRGQCRWPVGDPRDAGFFFCGGDAEDGKPYCAHHARRAHA